ncbi:MAG: DNA repair protein RecO [Eubacterium sp.]|jgi:DNA repair protein RecO (recombination protein O)|nr:DNA repair protein RecO [Eubacterium sp.]
MEQNIVLTGMVLNVMPIGEYDKRITVLTKERGKITAFARGARRPTSQLLAVTAPFSFGEFEFFQGRSTYNLRKASISNYFRGLSADPIKACYGFYFLEVADFYARENNNEKELLKLLYLSLRALETGKMDCRLIRRVFELRVLLEAGECPDVSACRCCGKKEGLKYFSAQSHGMLCGACFQGGDGIKTEDSAVYAMQYALASEVKKLYTFTVSEEVLSQLERILDRIFVEETGHTFRALEIIKEMGQGMY